MAGPVGGGGDRSGAALNRLEQVQNETEQKSGKGAELAARHNLMKELIRHIAQA